MTEAILIFPVHGIDVSAPFRMQRSVKQGDQWVKLANTQHAVNVRAYDREGRMRGGTRGGLSRYINAKVNDYWIIQHLSMIVTTDTDAVA